jgi:hypothetical protein
MRSTRNQWGFRLKIYIASPYSANSAKGKRENVIKAIDAGLALWKKGHSPYIPHLTHFIDHRAKMTNIPMKWEDYIEWDKTWLQACDAILYLGESKGTEIELSLAKKLGKIIFFSINSVPNALGCKDSLVVEQ